MRVYADYALSRADDAVLVRRMQGGDEAAFEAIFKRHQAPLLSYCRHMLGNRDEGEDALQQAFIKAHQALLGGTAPRELRPWLYAIARNCCLSAVAARRPTAPLADRMPVLAGLSDQVRQREDLRELVAGIGRLPEDQRSALLLAELDDLNHRAIATIVGCEVSKVKALIYQARSALIADRDARNASCQDIREQLSMAHGGELRRGPLRRHLKLCVGCRDFQLAVSTQRESFAAVLPVLPSAGLAAAILSHGAAHAVGAASVGGAGVGATATGGTGIAASGTAAATAAASTAVGGGLVPTTAGTGIGALVGGGLVTKLAVGGAIVVLASAGAVTVHDREAHATPHRATHLELAFAGAKGRRISATDIADSSSLRPGSSASFVLADWTRPPGPAGAPGTGPAAELSGLGGADPLLTPSEMLTPGTAAASSAPPGIPGQAAVTPGQSKSGTEHDRAARAKHRVALRRRQALLRHRALLRQQRLAVRRRARLRKALRKALRRRHPPTTPKPPKSPAAKPPVTPAPVRVPHYRKARTTPAASTVSAPAATTTTGSAPPEASRPRHPKPTSTGTTGIGTGTSTSKTGSERTGTGEGTGKTSTGTSGAGKSGAGKEAAGSDSGTGAGTASSGSPTGIEKTSSAAGGGRTAPGKTASGTGAGETASGTAGETGAGKVRAKKPLVEAAQLPNL